MVGRYSHYIKKKSTRVIHIFELCKLTRWLKTHLKFWNKGQDQRTLKNLLVECLNTYIPKQSR